MAAVQELLGRVSGLNHLVRRPEYQPPHFQIVDLLNMNSSSFEWEELKKGVRRTKGHMDILVQPYHREEDLEIPFPATETYRRNRDQLVQTALNEGRPLLVFEPGSNTQLLAHRIGSEKGVLYKISTCGNDDPTPDAIKQYTNNWPFWSPRELDMFHRHTWKQVRDVLRSAGVKAVSVGGRYLVFSKATNTDSLMLDRLRQYAKTKPKAREWVERDLIPKGNVGSIARQLLIEGFDVNFSPASSPAERLEPTNIS